MNLKKIVQNAAFKDFRNIGLLLALTTLLFHLTDLDIAVQKFFYSPAQGWRWSVSHFGILFIVSGFSPVIC